MLKEKIMLACVYRSPNSSPDNSNDVNKSLKILSRRFSSNLLVVGDFNYPKIDWEHYSTTSSQNNLNSKFLECTRLYLVLTSNPDIIDKVKPDAPLGKNDYSVVEIIMENVLLTENKMFE